MSEEATVGGVFRVAKSNDTKQEIFGRASVVVKGGALVTDHQDDIIEPHELEAAAYEFVREARASGEDHNGLPPDAELIESVVITPEKLEAWGLAPDALDTGWWLGFHIPDKDAYERAKNEKSAFSIEGYGVREPVNG